MITIELTGIMERFGNLCCFFLKLLATANVLALLDGSQINLVERRISHAVFEQALEVNACICENSPFLGTALRHRRRAPGLAQLWQPGVHLNLSNNNN